MSSGFGVKFGEYYVDVLDGKMGGDRMERERRRLREEFGNWEREDVYTFDYNWRWSCLTIRPSSSELRG